MLAAASLRILQAIDFLFNEENFVVEQETDATPPEPSRLGGLCHQR